MLAIFYIFVFYIGIFNVFYNVFLSVGFGLHFAFLKCNKNIDSSASKYVFLFFCIAFALCENLK